MRVHNSNTGELTRWGRFSVGASLVATIGLAACSPGSSPEGKPTQFVTPSAGNESNDSPSVRVSNLPYPGRVALPTETCKDYSPQNPQPYNVRTDQDGNDAIYVPVDGRNSFPPNCDWRTDSVQLQKGPTVEAEDGPSVPAGTVVRVVGYTLVGQYNCNPNGGTSRWLDVTTGKQPNGREAEGWLWDGNVGFAPDLKDSVQANLPNKEFANRDFGRAANC